MSLAPDGWSGVIVKVIIKSAATSALEKREEDSEKVRFSFILVTHIWSKFAIYSLQLVAATASLPVYSGYRL